MNTYFTISISPGMTDVLGESGLLATLSVPIQRQSVGGSIAGHKEQSTKYNIGLNYQLQYRVYFY
jgi:hypothetical protein